MSATPAPKRLLLLKLGAIGDCVMLLPAAYQMHLAGYAIDWVCGRAVAPILQLYPWINLQIVDDQTLLRGSLLTRLAAIVSLWRTLPRHRYDIAAALYYDKRYRLLMLPVRARRRILLSHLDRAVNLLPGRHHTDEYFRILAGQKEDETPSQLTPVPAENLPPTPLPLSARPRFVLAPAGARNLLRDDALRRWPIAAYVQTAEALLAHGGEVVLSGGPDDAWASPHFAHLAGVPGFIDSIARFSLVETLALLDSAAVTVTHDTGPLHLAGIARTAIVSIFGPTDPYGRLPQRAGCIALWGGEGFACRPCYDGRNYAPCTNNGCVQQVTPQWVVAEVLALLTPEARALPPRVLRPAHTAPAARLVMPA